MVKIEVNLMVIRRKWFYRAQERILGRAARLQKKRNALIQRHADGILSLFPVSRLGWIAARLAPNPALNWYPGWKFGVGESDVGCLLQLRLSLWKFFEARRLQAPFTIRWYNGVRVTMYLGNDLSLCLYVAGTYEPNEFMFLSKLLRPGMTFIDVGANDGLYTLFASRNVGPTGRVIALEPSSREFARLERNLLLNHPTNVRVLRSAASNREGFGTLRIAGFGHEGQNTLGGFAYSVEQDGAEEIPLVTLDNVVNRYGLERIDVIKMDTEGGELRVLEGSQGILATQKPVILLEILDAALVHQDASRGAVLSFLESFGYRFMIFGPRGRPEPVASVHLDGVNIIAVHHESTVSV